MTARRHHTAATRVLVLAVLAAVACLLVLPSNTNAEEWRERTRRGPPPNDNTLCMWRSKRCTECQTADPRFCSRCIAGYKLFGGGCIEDCPTGWTTEYRMQEIGEVLPECVKRT